MSQKHRHAWIRFIVRPWAAVVLFFCGVLLCLAGLVLWAGYQTQQAFSQVQQGDFKAAHTHVQLSRPIVSSLNIITAGLIPDLVVWHEALTLPEQVQGIAQAATDISEQVLQNDHATSISSLSEPLATIDASLTIIDTQLPHTILLKYHIPEQYLALLPSAAESIQNLQTLIDSVSQGKQTWIIILQNSNELRATGGFPGSYVLLNFDNGVLAEMVVEDIYDADGQFKGYVGAPAGIREYTSGAQGLRLPDANWWPDFPQSAQTMLQFFALGDKRNIAGLVAVNLHTAQSLLSITGPLWLPDYNTEVNQENVGEVLRAERSDFFPGSTQKKHLLTLTLIQLKQKLSTLTGEQRVQLFSSLKKNIAEKDIQVYSTRPELQEIFSYYHLTGELKSLTVNTNSIQQCQCQPVALALVESNVGINKVNKYVTRSNTVQFDSHSLVLTSHFTNNAASLTATDLSSILELPTEAQPRNGNGYLNYYRILISPEYSVKSITIDGQPVAKWDQEPITTSAGEAFLQIGVLVGVPEQSSKDVKIELHTDRSTVPEALILFKQAGVPPTQYTVTTPTKSQQFLLDTNQAVTL